MASFWDNLVAKYKQGGLVEKLIFINVAVFLIQAVLTVFFKLFGLNISSLLVWLEVPASLSKLLFRPWTLFTYMFVHANLMHLFFNMLWLYFFGRLFLRYFGNRQFIIVYLGGGLAGALLYLLGYNLLPYYRPMVDFSILAGASAAILSLTVAMAFYRSEDELNLMFFGRVKMKWLAIAMIVIDVLSLTGDNGGGSLSHIGGALFGLAAGLYYRNFGLWQSDTSWKNVKANLNSRFGKKQAKTYHRAHSEYSDVDQAYRDQRKADSDRVDAILDKVKASGYDSLTQEEKQFLFQAGKK